MGSEGLIGRFSEFNQCSNELVQIQFRYLVSLPLVSVEKVMRTFLTTIGPNRRNCRSNTKSCIDSYSVLLSICYFFSRAFLPAGLLLKGFGLVTSLFHHLGPVHWFSFWVDGRAHILFLAHGT